MEGVGKVGVMAKIWVREGSDRIKVGNFSVVVVQSVRLLGLEMWVLAPWLEKAFDGFRQREFCRMAVMGPKFQRGCTWMYTPIGAALEMVGLEEIGVISPTARTRSYTILRLVLSWTCV